MICREGWPWLIGAAILWGVIFRVWGPAWSLPVVLLIGWLIFLFRDPGRQVPPLPLAVVAPVDGKVTEVVQYHDGVLPGKWTRIAIRTNHLGAYTVRSPIEGSIRDVREEARDVDPARLTCGLWVRSEEQDNVVLLFPGRRRRFAPKSFIRYGERVGRASASPICDWRRRPRYTCPRPRKFRFLQVTAYSPGPLFSRIWPEISAAGLIQVFSGAPRHGNMGLPGAPVSIRRSTQGTRLYGKAK
jgi:hypothetical protein